MAAALIHVDRRWTDMMKLIGTFHDYVKDCRETGTTTTCAKQQLRHVKLLTTDKNIE
jgi:hypothetical protein